MSGGGSYGGDGGGGPDTGMNCSTLTFQTALSSPVPTTIAKLTVGQQLSLELEKEGGPVLAKTKNGDVAGSIASSLLLALIKCMDVGHDYKATVKKITGGTVLVEVTHI